MSNPATPETIAATSDTGRLSRWRLALRHLHWFVTAFLIFALIPALHSVGLQFRIDWVRFLQLYWVGQALRSILAAAVLYLVAFSPRETLLPLWERYRKQKLRFFVVGAFTVCMLWFFGWAVGLVLIIDTVALLEVFDRVSGDPATLGWMATKIAVPASYLFVGLVLVFCYNDIIASLEFAEKYSPLLNQADRFLLGGWTVSQIAHAVMSRLPLWVYPLLGLIYFRVFSQVGATLILLSLLGSQKRALQFVAALLTAYYISLLVFFIMPTANPYMLCPGHFQRLSPSLNLYAIQQATELKARLLFAHKFHQTLGTDYFIAFPCMHIAMPVISLWFLRQWRRAVIFAAGFDVLVTAAILLQEQHFFVDLLAGAVVAAIAIFMVALPKTQAELDREPN